MITKIVGVALVISSLNLGAMETEEQERCPMEMDDSKEFPQGRIKGPSKLRQALAFAKTKTPFLSPQHRPINLAEVSLPESPPHKRARTYSTDFGDNMVESLADDFQDLESARKKHKEQTQRAAACDDSRQEEQAPSLNFGPIFCRLKNKEL